MMSPARGIVAGVALTPAERAERAVRAVQGHAPHLQRWELVELGRGLDNTAFRCGDVVVRVADGPSVGRERDLLAVVGPRVSIAVPAPVFVDEQLGVLAYPLLPGRPLLGRTPATGVARRLGAFLTELHSIDVSLVASLVEEETADPRDWLEDLTGAPALLAVVRATVPPPGARRALAHADLGAEHLLEEGGVVTGVLDWSDAAVTDPAVDFARLLRDFGPRFLGSVLDAYHLDQPDAGTMARIEFFARCAALEDLAFAEAGGRTEYASAAGTSLGWLFPGIRSS
jgi:aminoglycoside phosphotransferase (APT) family kinase protein